VQKNVVSFTAKSDKQKIALEFTAVVAWLNNLNGMAYCLRFSLTGLMFDKECRFLQSA